MHAYGVTSQMPLWRDSQQLLLLVEQAVRDFPRYHKYTVGSELRRQAMRICRLLARACHDKEQRLAYVIQLNEAIDDLKIQLQLAKALAAFRHFKAFETIARLALPFTHKSPSGLPFGKAPDAPWQRCGAWKGPGHSLRAAPCPGASGAFSRARLMGKGQG